MGLLLENFKMALSSIKSNKMRSFLTMLGIIIGIMSVITIATIGDSVKSTFNRFVSGFGKNRIMIYVNWTLLDSGQLGENAYFTQDDIDTLKEKFKDKITYIAPESYYRDTVKNGKNQLSVSIVGVDCVPIKEVTSSKLIYGRELNQSDLAGRKKVVLIEKSDAGTLFGKENAVGEKINVTLHDTPMTFSVVGVYEKETTIFDKLNNDRPNIYIPYTSADSPRSYIYGIDLKLNDGCDAKKDGEKILSYIARLKKTDKESYQLNTIEEAGGMITGMLSTLSLGLGAIAAISLLVGGIGIMNIMLVSVTERTKEIGIRKSIGARKKDILTQFLIESVILSGMGGLIGTCLGIGISLLASSLMHIDATVSIKSIIIAVGFSSVVGVFFGLYPANKAAKLNPIDALRYE